jgi:hypothetical protein
LLLFNDDSKELVEALLDLIHEVGLAKADDSQ